MVDNPSPVGPTSPTPSNQKAYGVQDIKGFHCKPMTFLGMHFNAKEAGQLWQLIDQSIGQQIEREKQAMLKALKKLGNSNQ